MRREVGERAAVEPARSRTLASVKHATDYLWFKTPNRRDYVNITDRVDAFVRASGIEHGLCLVSPMHITAAVYVNDAESGLIRDIDAWLERSRPTSPSRSTATTTERTTPMHTSSGIS